MADNEKNGQVEHLGQTEIYALLQKLSSKRVLERKEAIRCLSVHLHLKDAHIARLSLHYVSEHDPAYTVRNIARQAFYQVGAPPSRDATWDKAYVF
jgi:hypothetical protein